jgi:hypothetical protein
MAVCDAALIVRMDRIDDRFGWRGMRAYEEDSRRAEAKRRPTYA